MMRIIMTWRDVGSLPSSLKIIPCLRARRERLREEDMEDRDLFLTVGMMSKPGGMKEKRRECRGRLGRVIRFQSSVKPLKMPRFTADVLSGVASATADDRRSFWL